MIRTDHELLRSRPRHVKRAGAGRGSLQKALGVAPTEAPTAKHSQPYIPPCLSLALSSSTSTPTTMRIPAARPAKLLASQRRPLPGCAHQRPAVRPITSQAAAPSIHRKQPNSTLAIQDRPPIDDAILHGIPSSQPHPSFPSHPSPFAPKGERSCVYRVRTRQGSP